MDKKLTKKDIKVGDKLKVNSKGARFNNHVIEVKKILKTDYWDFIDVENDIAWKLSEVVPFKQTKTKKIKKEIKVGQHQGHPEIYENLIEETLKSKELSNSSNFRLFDSGAKRDSNKGKPFVHNIKGYTRLRFGYHMTLNASKYGDKNWELGMPTEQYLESVDRHLAKYLEGNREEDHLSAILFGIQGCMMNEKKDGIKEDEYYKKLNNDNT